MSAISTLLTYTIICGSLHTEPTLVNKAIQDGWKPTGGVAIYLESDIYNPDKGQKAVYCQAMVKD